MMLLQGMGPVVDALVLMLPGAGVKNDQLEEMVDRFVQGVFEMCAAFDFDPPRVRWATGNGAGFVVMDARLSADALRRMWPQGKVYGHEYRLDSKKDREALELWMVGRQPDEEGWR